MALLLHAAQAVNVRSQRLDARRLDCLARVALGAHGRVRVLESEALR